MKRSKRRPDQEAARVAVGYVRVSTAKQAKEGDSLEAQRARIEAWATMNGYTLANVHVDAGLSGGRSDNRPALQAALAEVTQARGTLVCYSLSRLARSTRDTLDIAERLERAGADLVSLSESIDTTGACGRMVFKMLAVLAEFERELISERTSVSLSLKQSKGEKTGGYLPYGFDVDDQGVLIENAAEQAIITLMREMQESGLSLRKIAARLNDMGHRQKRGGEWSHIAVDRTLRNTLARQESNR